MGRQIVCCAKGVAFSRSCGILGSEKKPVRKGLPMQKFDHVLLASDFDNTLVYTCLLYTSLNAPINDLSRGCNAQEVYSMAIITAALA